MAKQRSVFFSKLNMIERKAIKKYLTNTIIVFCSILFFACSREKPGIKVGISHANIKQDWGSLLFQDIVNELSLYYEYDISLVVRDAQLSARKQKNDLKEMLDEGIDVLILFALDSISTVPVVEEIYDRGIPVVVVDRKINTEKYSTFITNDNVKIGYTAGNYAITRLKGRGAVMEICGDKGSSTATERSAGFRKALEASPGIKIASVIYGDWIENVTFQKTDSVFQTGFVPDLIFAHTDLMAQNAFKVCQKYQVRPIIFGVDGLPLKNSGIDMLLKRQIDATFNNNPGGAVAAKAAMLLVKKVKVDKTIILKTFPIDLNNAESIKVSYEAQLEQFAKIKQQQQQISTMAGKIHSQHLAIYISAAFIVLLVIAVFAVLYFLKQKQVYISLIQEQKVEIERQVEESRRLSGQLMKSNKILQSQREEILKKNEFLENYKNKLEQLVQERTNDLRAALAKAQESDKLKTAFLSNLSHEIRTPLNSILGFTELMKSSDYSQLAKENFQSVIIQNSNQLLNSITQIIEISKLTTEEVEVKKSVCAARSFFDELHNETTAHFRQVLEFKGNKVELLFIAPPDVTLETDVLRVKQVIRHLIDNALKFTELGNIYIGMEIINENKVQFFVRDTGIGIKKENQEIIFERFVKIEDDVEVLYRGLGLGLTISKHIVELLEGEITVKSDLGKGTEFSFAIPCRVEKQINKQRENATINGIADLNKLTILVAEDEDSNFVYLEAMLKAAGAIVKRAKNGKEAVEISKKSRPDIILMDIKMPVMGGVEAFKIIRGIYTNLPVIAITAYTFVNEKETILSNGFNGYLSKPFVPKELHSVLKEVLQNL
ncbi:MAG: substrate-binding domain-containing protein [Bacteroidales bacterium]|nr:substrate-binding domain-containing protein [Bacteroidales bacterium]